MPAALVTLMAIDQSVIVYPKYDEMKVGDKTYKFSRMSKADYDATNQYWERRQKEIEEKKRLKKLKEKDSEG